jgi:hypothetical protein
VSDMQSSTSAAMTSVRLPPVIINAACTRDTIVVITASGG